MDLFGSGPAVCVGTDIDTDMVIAGRYLRTRDRSVWAEHVFEDLDPALAPRLKGAVLVAGRNFGCGSSREQAAVALREAGVLAVVAISFARIFYRNGINLGIPLLECPDIVCTEGEKIRFNISESYVEVAKTRYSCRPLSPRMLDILTAGGLVEHWRSRQR